MTANVLDELIDDEKIEDEANPANPEDIALARCEATAESLDRLYRQSIDFLNSGERRPQETLYDAAEVFLECVAMEPSVGWPHMAWAFLEHATALAESVSQYGRDWRGDVGTWSPVLSKQIAQASSERENLLDMTPPTERVVVLEPIEDLVEQKLNDRQIAKIYDWTDSHGNPDTSKARSCRKGKVKAPDTKTYAPSFSGPTRQPHLGPIDNCIGIFEELRAATAGKEVATA